MAGSKWSPASSPLAGFHSVTTKPLAPLHIGTSTRIHYATGDLKQYFVSLLGDRALAKGVQLSRGPEQQVDGGEQSQGQELG